MNITLSIIPAMQIKRMKIPNTVNAAEIAQLLGDGRGTAKRMLYRAGLPIHGVLAHGG